MQRACLRPGRFRRKEKSFALAGSQTTMHGLPSPWTRHCNWLRPFWLPIYHAVVNTYCNKNTADVTHRIWRKCLICDYTLLLQVWPTFIFVSPFKIFKAIGQFSLRAVWTLWHCRPDLLPTFSFSTITKIYMAHERILWGGSDTGDASIRGNELVNGETFSKNELLGLAIL